MTSLTLTKTDLGEAGQAKQGPRAQRTISRPRRIDRWLAAQLQRITEPAAVRVELWDGSSPWNPDRTAIGDMVVHDRATLVRLILNGDLWFGEAYMAGRLEIRGGLQRVVEALSRLRFSNQSWRHRVAASISLP